MYEIHYSILLSVAVMIANCVQEYALIKKNYSLYGLAHSCVNILSAFIVGSLIIFLANL